MPAGPRAAASLPNRNAFLVAVERALLLLADIVGYTTFMRLHRINLAHSQDITRRLLESMVDAVPSLRLVEIEGDAVFLYAPQDEDDPRTASGRVLALTLVMHQAFHARQEWMVAQNMCACEACKQVGTLRVKFVAHVGEVATQTIRRRTKLVGIDVIAAHRMLKNDVPVPEYLLISDSMFERCDPDLLEHSAPIEQELEGIGTMTAHFIDLDTIALDRDTPVTPTVLSRLRETTAVIFRCFPRVVGLRRLRAPDRAEQLRRANRDPGGLEASV
jgi:Protein of unknown function (DUF2652)